MALCSISYDPFETPESEIQIITVSGDLLGTEVARLAEMLASILECGSDGIVLNMCETQLLDRGFFGMIQQFQWECFNRNLPIVVVSKTGSHIEKIMVEVASSVRLASSIDEATSLIDRIQLLPQR